MASIPGFPGFSKRSVQLIVVAAILLPAIALLNVSRYSKSAEQVRFQTWLELLESKIDSGVAIKPVVITIQDSAKPVARFESNDTRDSLEDIIHILALINDSSLIGKNEGNTSRYSLTVTSGNDQFRAQIPDGSVQSDVRVQNIITLVQLTGATPAAKSLAKVQ